MFGWRPREHIGKGHARESIICPALGTRDTGLGNSPAVVVNFNVFAFVLLPGPSYFQLCLLVCMNVYIYMYVTVSVFGENYVYF